MSDSSTIEWTDATWNPVTGCTKVSPGCDHCYAERLTERFHGRGSFERVVLHPERLEVPLHWRVPRRIFVNSMSDLFHAEIPRDFLAQVFQVMHRCPQHTFQVLTKRAERMERVVTAWQGFGAEGAEVPELPRPWWRPQPHIWLGVSVESPAYYSRIRHLARTPAAVRFLSCEPLLTALPDLPLDGISWVIVGGESGPGARPMHPDWARGIRDQCRAAGVPFFFKQWGAWAPVDRWRYGRGTGVFDGRQPGVPFVQPAWPGWALSTDVPGVQPMERTGKHAAGRLLDGRLWDDYPCPAERPAEGAA